MKRVNERQTEQQSMESNDARGSDQSSPINAAGGDSLPGIRHIITVASAKGGVGKSTAAVNVAPSMQQIGGRVGLVDDDVFGPSIPGMLGLPTGEPPATSQDGTIMPADAPLVQEWPNLPHRPGSHPTGRKGGATSRSD